jgi:hypothetical protein
MVTNITFWMYMKLNIVLYFYLFLLLLNVYHIICNNFLYEDIYLRNMSGKKVLYFQSFCMIVF